MPFNGAGGFVSLGGATFPAVPGTTILAAQYNDQLNDIFGGLGQVITRNGQSPWTANLPAGGFKLTGLTAGTTTNDSVAFGQAAVTFGTVTAAVAGASSLNVLKAGDTMSGTLISTSGIVLSSRAVSGFIEGTDPTGATQYGFLQFNGTGATAISVLLRANGAGVLQLLGAGGGISIAPTGVISAATLFDTSAVIRSTGSTGAPSTGSGLELFFSSGAGNLLAYNRTGAAYLPMTFGASAYAFQIGGATKATLDASGDFGVNGTPVYRIHGFGTGSAGAVFAMTNTDASGAAVFLQANTSSDGRGGTLTNHPFYLCTNSVPQVALSTAGDFTIGGVAGSGYKFTILATTNFLSQFDSTSATAGYSIWSKSGVAYGFVGYGAAIGGGATDFTVRSEAALTLAYSGGTSGLRILAATGVVDITQGSGKLTMAGGLTRFESTEQACPTTTTLIGVAHGGPRKPDAVRVVMRCKITEAGWAVGDELNMCDAVVDASRASQSFGNASNCGVIYTGAGINPSVRSTTGTLTAVTAANWRVVMYASWL